MSAVLLERAILAEDKKFEKYETLLREKVENLGKELYKGEVIYQLCHTSSQQSLTEKLNSFSESFIVTIKETREALIYFKASDRLLHQMELSAELTDEPFDLDDLETTAEKVLQTAFRMFIGIYNLKYHLMCRNNRESYFHSNLNETPSLENGHALRMVEYFIPPFGCWLAIHAKIFYTVFDLLQKRVSKVHHYVYSTSDYRYYELLMIDIYSTDLTIAFKNYSFEYDLMTQRFGEGGMEFALTRLRKKMNGRICNPLIMENIMKKVLTKAKKFMDWTNKTIAISEAFGKKVDHNIPQGAEIHKHNLLELKMKINMNLPINMEEKLAIFFHIQDFMALFFA